METRKLTDLVSVGKATERDFHRLEIYKVEELVGQSADDLYDRLKALNGGAYLDMCVHDVFTCAIAQAENPNLPYEKKQWWYWSKVRKALK